MLRILVPLLLVLGAVLWLLYRADLDALQAILRANERHAIELADRTIHAELGMLRGDALYLAQQSSLHQWLDTGTVSSLESLENDLLAFVRSRGRYDQVRLLDEQGQEQVRVNWDDGQPRLVPASGLQDKSTRYYVEKTLALGQGEIYTSPFDLNIENNAVEQPVKPVIRIGTPVFDGVGRKRGFILLNYLGQRLLGQVRKVGKLNDGGVWLLNAKGYWLLGPDPGKEWGFMYPDRQEMRFQREYGEVWTAALNGPPQAQLTRNEGIFTYARVLPELSPLAGDSGGWILMTYVPASLIAGNMAEHNHSLIYAFVALALLLALVSGLIARKDMQRRQAETRIRESEARFRGLLDSAPDAIVIVDQNGVINLVNSQAEKWFGYSRDELLGKPIEWLVPERFRKHHIAQRQGYTAMPVARPMGLEMDLHGLRKDGSEFPVEISLSPLETERGLLVSSIIRDVTARKRAEEAQHQMQMRYKELITNLPVGVYRNTPGAGGCFLEVNPAMVEIFEAKSAAELLSHPVRELYCDPDAREAVSDKLMRTGQIKSEELHLKTLRGRNFIAAITAVLKKDARGEVYFDGIVEDVSERKESELCIQQLNQSLRARSAELETINHELEAFSYSVSHDLRAPLRAMDGFSRTLLNEYTESLDEKGKDRLNRIRAGAQRMAALIDDLLKLSRVSRTEIKREPVDLTGMAQEVMDELQQNEPQRKVQFTVQPDLCTQGDARLLRVVMDNLLGNAWKFTGQRADAIIEMGRSQDGAEYSYFIRDNGAGFDMAYADKLFGAFQRLHDTGEFPGTGIGLATVQRVIRKHGGRIWAESAVGEGATFYFTLA